MATFSPSSLGDRFSLDSIKSQWLRVYTMVGGSAQQGITDDQAEVFKGNWQRTQLN